MVFTVLGALVLLLDQITKLYVASRMTEGQTIPVIENVFHITYQINTGAAFSILKGQRWLLIAAPIIAIVAFFVYLIRKRPSHPMFLLAFSLIVSGAAGNLIDRLWRGGVVDFFDFRLINFPVFNVADCAVVVGAALFCAYMMFFEGRNNEKV